MELLAARLWLWDEAYTFAGVARSEEEERSREHLWEYVRYCRSIDEFALSDMEQYKAFESSLDHLLHYAQRFKVLSLTPFQEALRKKLETIGALDPPGAIWKAEDRYSWDFDPVSLTEEDKDEKDKDKDNVNKADEERRGQQQGQNNQQHPSRSQLRTHPFPL